VLSSEVKVKLLE